MFGLRRKQAAVDEAMMPSKANRFTALGSAILLAAGTCGFCGTGLALTPPLGNTIFTFTGDSTGSHPYAGLVAGANGVLYGTTMDGGANGLGAVYSLTPPATKGGAWTEAVIWSFAGGTADGDLPSSGLVRGSNGVLYGTTQDGGADGYGTAYSLTPPATSGGAWTETILHSFAAGSDGSFPQAGLTLGGHQVLFGTTVWGGAFSSGTAFALSPPIHSGGAWTETVIYSFEPHPDAALPMSALLHGKNGVLYGASANGGVGWGTVFELIPPSGAGDNYSDVVLYTFSGGADGGVPRASLVTDGTNIFSTAEAGGNAGVGTVFELSPSGSSWTENTLYSFGSVAGDGNYPLAGFVLGKGGKLYGTTGYGGAYNGGTVFALFPPTGGSSSWTESVLHSFTYGADGAALWAGLTVSNGNIFGTNELGGTYPADAGTIFMLSLPLNNPAPPPS
jgi:uncharacterized repeat protein (TIGR03803 family)